MYLHLGQSVVVPYRDVIGIFDLDNTTSSHLTRAFLKRAEQGGRVISVSGDLPRSFVICKKPDQPEAVVYLCQPSAATLLRRAEGGGFGESISTLSVGKRMEV